MFLAAEEVVANLNRKNETFSPGRMRRRLYPPVLTNAKGMS